MTYLVVDGNAAEAFGRSIVESLPQLDGTFRLIEYSQLERGEEFPVGRYIFLGLSTSSPGRISRAVEAECRIRRTGSDIWNPPSFWAEDDTRLKVAMRVTPALKLRSALEEPSLPCILRAGDSGNIRESGIIDSRADFDAVLLDWVLQCIDPELILAVSIPEGGLKIETVYQAGAHWFSSDLEVDRYPDRLGTPLRTDLAARLDLTMMPNGLHTWRFDDSPAALLERQPVLRACLEA